MSKGRARLAQATARPKRYRAMKQKRTGYEIVPFPRGRHAIVDSMIQAQRKRVTHALLEVDVTEARRYLGQHRARTGESLSFTAFIAACLAKAVDENKYLHAYRKGRNRLVLFDEVDVSVAVERELGGEIMPLLPLVIRRANKKTLGELHLEIRSSQAKQVEEPRGMWFYAALPTFMRVLFWRTLNKNPHLMKRLAGTVAVSAVGMFGRGAAWGIPLPLYTLTLTVGGIAEKPGVVEGQVQVREYLSLTISMDHDVIDGAPAARFIQRLKELVERGYGLPGQDSNAGDPG